MELITRKELAKEFKVSSSTIYNWTREKKIPYLKIGPRLVRYNLSEVKESMQHVKKENKKENGIDN